MNLPPELRYQNSREWPKPRSYPLRLAWATRLGRERRWLRRMSKDRTCINGWWCNAYVWVGDARSTLPRGDEGDGTQTWPLTDKRWPAACKTCGRNFTAGDEHQYLIKRLYAVKSPEYGHVVVTTDNFPPGTVYHAAWLKGCAWATGPDGLSLHAVCPDGHPWNIDGEASNCTMPQAVPVPGKPGWTHFVRTHYCWVRHGDPRHPETLTVDKNGKTCNAGAGSIATGTYHGFLTNGGFTAG